MSLKVESMAMALRLTRAVDSMLEPIIYAHHHHHHSNSDSSAGASDQGGWGRPRAAGGRQRWWGQALGGAAAAGKQNAAGRVWGGNATVAAVRACWQCLCGSGWDLVGGTLHHAAPRRIGVVHSKCVRAVLVCMVVGKGGRGERAARGAMQAPSQAPNDVGVIRT